MRHSTTNCSVAVLILVSLGAPAHGAPAVALRRSALPASACVGLFGGPGAQQANRGRRTRMIYWVAAGADRVMLAHASDWWQAPRPLVLDGLTVVRVAQRHATVAVARATAARFGCQPGAYIVGRDMAFGGAAVLDVLDEGLLVERRGRLRFVGRDGARSPDWLMIWGSPFEIAVPPEPALAAYRAAYHLARIGPY